MSRQIPRWKPESGVRAVRDADGYVMHHETWVGVSDGLGGHWTVTVDGDRLTSLAVHADNVQQLDLRSVPLVDVRAVALAHVREVDRLRDQYPGAPLGDLLDEVSADPADVMPDGRTRVVDFVAAWQAAGPQPRADGQVDRTPRREALARRFGVSVYGIDKWVRHLRDQGLLEESATRRNRATRTTGPDGAGSPEERNER